MKRKTIWVIMAVGLLGACRKEHLWGMRGKGPLVKETRDITGFEGVSLDVDGEVTYMQDSAFYVEVNVQENIKKHLETKVKNGILEIDFNRNVRKYETVEIVLHSPVVRSLSVDGCGTIRMVNDIHTPAMQLNISGSGSIYVNALTTTAVDAQISGSGNIHVANGAANMVKLAISGSGKINAIALAGNKVGVEISGSGDVYIKAIENLDASISGSGSVYYDGTPQVNTDISGSGNVKHI